MHDTIYSTLTKPSGLHDDCALYASSSNPKRTSGKI